MKENQTGMLILGAVVVLLMLLLTLFGGGDNRLGGTAIGTNGLEIWLNDQDIPAARSHARTQLAEQDVALRVLPLYDMDLSHPAPEATTREHQRRQDSLSDIDAETLIEKISYVPTLLALPKWRAGVLELDLLDEQLLIPAYRYKNLLSELGPWQLTLTRPDRKFLQSSRGITLYRPQLFALTSVTGSCSPHVTLPEGVLIARCDQHEELPVYILSDPDLLNNHGLALGNNAAVARDIIAGLVGSDPGTVYVDTSTEIQLAINPDEAREIRPRTVEDISRYLTYPFSLIWLGAGLCFVIMLWRGLIRFGPPRRVDEGQIAASKSASIAAKGYLMRLAGDDRSLLRAFVTEKMQALGRETLGKQAQTDPARLMARLHVIAPRGAPALQKVLTAVEAIPDGISATDLALLADRFEQTYRSIRDELGYVSRGR